uniref:Nitrate transporter 1.2 n=1 Tax=Anthurium amnicola TaxID=1678845 RepID=A0A1D1YSN1_9ARAE
MAAEGFVDWKGSPVDKRRHGGTRAAMFIYFLVVMSNMAYVSNVLNLVTYLHGTMHTGVASSSTTVTNFIGGTCAFALLGAFVSDSYITRLKTMLIFGPFQFLGFGLLALQAHVPSLRPPQCDTAAEWSNCKQIHGFNAGLLYVAMYTIALGEGCIRAALASFGGDQFDNDDPVESQKKSSFFNWFAFGISLGAFTGLILIVWIENNRGWDWGFALSAFVILLGLVALACGFPFYRNFKPVGSPLTRLLQVLVAAFKNRKLILPQNVDDLGKQHAQEDTVGMEDLPPTKGLRFLEKAAISHGRAGGWSYCTTTKVEETKAVLRMVPIFVSATLSYTPAPLIMTFTVQQGSTMNTKLGKIHIAPASLLVIPVVFQMVILVAYDRFFVPFARRITGYTSGITHLQRVGIGFLSISLATCVAAIIERKRKMLAEESGLTDSGVAVPMSVLWLGMQFFVLGITDVSAFVGLLEFFNSEAPRGMKSMGTAIFWCVIGLSSLMGTFLVEVVNRCTRRGDGVDGWLEGNNLNRSQLDLFYWLLSVLGLVALLNYLYWARKYAYRQDPRVKQATTGSATSHKSSMEL